jgi:NAD+ synthase
VIAQSAVAGVHAGLAAGTDQGAEAVMGFFTKYGDGGFGLTPLAQLSRRQERFLAEELVRRRN